MFTKDFEYQRKKGCYKGRKCYFVMMLLSCVSSLSGTEWPGNFSFTPLPALPNTYSPFFVFVKGNIANGKTCQYEEDQPFLGVTSMGLPFRICQSTNRPQVTLDGPTPKSPWLFNAIWRLRSLGECWGAYPSPAGSCHAVTAAPH